MKLCGVVFCQRPVHARKLCKECYDRARRYGALKYWPKVHEVPEKEGEGG